MSDGMFLFATANRIAKAYEDIAFLEKRIARTREELGRDEERLNISRNELSLALGAACAEIKAKVG